MEFRRYAPFLRKLERYLLAAFLCSLPFDWIKPTGWLVLLVIVSWVVRKPVHRGLQEAARFPGFWLLAGIALLHLLAPLYGDSLASLRQPVEKKTGLLVLPLYFATTRIRPWEAFLWIRAFVVGCLLLGISALIISPWMHAQQFPEMGPEQYLTGQSLLWFLGVHRVYASMALLIAVSLLSAHPAFAAWRQGRFAALLFLLVLVVLLGSKLYLALLPVLGLIVALRSRRRYRIIVSAVVLGLGVLAAASPFVQRNVQSTLTGLDPPPPAEVRLGNSLATRLYVWQASWEALKERPIRGYGVKGAHYEIQERLEKMGFQEAVRHQLNAHNQYIQIWLELGLVALLWLGAALGAFAWRSCRQGAPEGLLIAVIIAAGLLTENMLERQMGVLTISFFLAFGWFGGLSHPPDKEAISPHRT